MTEMQELERARKVLYRRGIMSDGREGDFISRTVNSEVLAVIEEGLDKGMGYVDSKRMRRTVDPAALRLARVVNDANRACGSSSEASE